MRPIIIIALLATLISGCSKPIEESFKHRIEYSVSIQFGNPVMDGRGVPEIDYVKNVTLIVPLPFRNGTPMNISLLSTPKGWDASIIETEHGMMLLLKAEKLKTWRMEKIPVPITPESQDKPEIPEEKRPASYEFRVRLKLIREVNTLNPLENEYVLQPKLGLNEIKCGEDAKFYPFARCYSYFAPIYFSSEPFVDAGVSVWLGGDNWWFTYGWTGNEFDDHLFVNFEEPGWKLVKGNLNTGKGVYRK